MLDRVLGINLKGPYFLTQLVARWMIDERRVAIDGVVLETPATLLSSLRGVTVDGAAVQDAAPARLFLFHKPAGVLTRQDLLAHLV